MPWSEKQNSFSHPIFSGVPVHSYVSAKPWYTRVANALAQSKWETVGLNTLHISLHATRVDVASTRGK
jgi:hypothetical protein